MKLPRGLRNNNPLNIRHSASRWQGARVEQTDKSFVQFTSMTMGYRAAWRILETYYKRFEAQHKPFTPRNIILRWAPPNENDSEAYLRRVCQLTNLAGNEALVRPSRVNAQSIQSPQSLQSIQSSQSSRSSQNPQSSRSSQSIRSPQSPRSSQNPPSIQNPQNPQPLLNDAYTTPDPQAKTKPINLLAAMTCVENGITMKEVDRGAIEKGLLLVRSEESLRGENPLDL